MYKFPPLENSLRNKLVYSKKNRISPKDPQKVMMLIIILGDSVNIILKILTKNLSSEYDNYDNFKDVCQNQT